MIPIPTWPIRVTLRYRLFTQGEQTTYVAAVIDDYGIVRAEGQGPSWVDAEAALLASDALKAALQDLRARYT